MKNFPSPDAAAKWLHKNVHPLAVKYNYEIAANIFKDIGNYRIGELITEYDPHNSPPANLSRSPFSGWVWVAYWHSHAEGSYSEAERFSGVDLEVIKKLLKLGVRDFYLSKQTSDKSKNEFIKMLKKEIEKLK